MCGLNGAAGTLDFKAEATFKDLLFLHVTRGDHSTGAASIGRGLKDTPKVAKCLGQPWLLMDMGKFKRDVMGGSNKVLMGHNRFATRGGISMGNAHPFLFENVFGAHNGTVLDVYVKNLPERDYFVTDSETIINAIDKIGIEETIKKVNGAWALTWYDHRDNTINLLRNDKRPLFFAFNKSHDQLFWASELDFLAYAMNHNHIDRDKPQAYLLPINHWFSWKIPEYNEPFDQATRKALECAPEVVHDTAPFHGRTGGTTVSGITDHYDQKRIPFYRNGKEGNVVDIAASKTREHIHEKLMSGRKGPAFPMIFRSDNCKIHYDVEAKKFHRYWYSPTEYEWHHTSHDNAPIEVADTKLEELLAAPINFSPANENNVTPEVDKTYYLRFRSPTLCVYKKPMQVKDPKPWVHYYWDKDRKVWSVHEDSSPPLEMPFQLLDVDASHFFYTKKKKRGQERMQYYKGFNGELLSRERFNQICQDGCVGCGRIPRWLVGKMGGVRVHFINMKDFLCEFCGEDSETFKGLLAASKDQPPTIN